MDERIDLTENRVFKKDSNVDVVLLDNTDKRFIKNIINKNYPVSNIVCDEKIVNSKFIEDQFNPDIQKYKKMFEGNCDRCGKTILNQKRTLCESCYDFLDFYNSINDIL